MTKQFRKMQMWITDNGDVYSYNTWVGVIDYRNNTLYEWGYGNYSTTTSKQITILCRDKHLTRKHITDKELFVTNYKYN